MENPVHWFNREVGRSSTEWTVGHWAAFVGVVGAVTLAILSL